MNIIELGSTVKDRVTGFKGVATARITYLNGCDRYAVQPPVNRKGEMQEAKYFDAPDLEIIETAKAITEKKGAKTGGPHDHNSI